MFFYCCRFVIFTLLIPFVHREGGIGQQARDALLLCMSLSKKNENVGSYIAEHSNVCPVSVILHTFPCIFLGLVPQGNKQLQVELIKSNFQVTDLRCYGSLCYKCYV
jgi:hypothetical protein